ncbi:hypothetical protein EYF80_040768 [Liparis tanakae]|uniref:Uncharacterized protein n=1 Tax=Liparis tanakae TaxID=230148 RepID=A0A4Z2G613_9TELE|nr:hypothetical protein EYF80_040768 [Liparis tanakae]
MALSLRLPLSSSSLLPVDATRLTPTEDGVSSLLRSPSGLLTLRESQDLPHVPVLSQQNANRDSIPAFSLWYSWSNQRQAGDHKVTLGPSSSSFRASDWRLKPRQRQP